MNLLTDARWNRDDGNKYRESCDVTRTPAGTLSRMMRELSWCGTSRTLSGSPAELNDLEFEADGKLEIALNAAFIKLQEFAYDRDLRRSDPGA